MSERRGATATSSVCGCCAAAARFPSLRCAWRVRLTAKAAAACSGARLRASWRAASPSVPCSFEHADLHPLLYFDTVPAVLAVIAALFVAFTSEAKCFTTMNDALADNCLGLPS